MPSIRQRFHLSPCSDFRSHFYIMLSSETVEVVPLVMSVVEQLAIEVTASFWAPVTGVSRETLLQEVHRAFASALEQAGRGGEPAGNP